MNITKETRNGTPFTRISDPVLHYTVGYFTNNSWLDDDNVLVSEGKGRTDFSDATIYLVNLVEGTKKTIVEHCRGFNYLLHDTTLFYIRDKVLHSIDLNTNEDKEICTCEYGISLPHCTSDGKYISWETHKDGRHACYVVEVETGKVELAFEKSFEPPFDCTNHYMICPTDHNKIFFAHEGNTEYITNRLWLWEKDKGMRCIAKQYLDEDGNLGDCFGHECWAPDGKGLWFVKYPVSPQPPKGLSYVDLEGNQRIAVYGKYPYWHVSCSADGKYLAADTQLRTYAGPIIEGLTEEEMSLVYDTDCCLINLETGEEKAVISVVTNSKHPCHPHPALSPNSKWMCFHDFVDGQVTVGFVKLEDVK